MSFEGDLNSHLSGDASIVGQCADRVWPAVRPQADQTLPAITTQIISTVPASDLDNADGSLLNKRAQIDVWASSYDSARNVAELVRTRMKTAASSFNATMIDDQDFYESDTKIYRVSMDFSCWYDIP